MSIDLVEIEKRAEDARQRAEKVSSLVYDWAYVYGNDVPALIAELWEAQRARETARAQVAALTETLRNLTRALLEREGG